jgi:hypothetical protein
MNARLSFSARLLGACLGHGALLGAAELPAPPKLLAIPGVEKSIVVAATAVAPKNGEQTVIRLEDGRLFLLWSEFLREDLLPAAERPPASPLRRNPTGDDGYARISGMTSSDGGRSWSKPWVVVDDRDALVNCISPGITRMADGRLLLAYSWRSGGNGRTNYGNCAKMVRISSDEGRTWSERLRITPDGTDYHTGCHDRAYTLAGGRIVVQCHTILPPGVAQPGQSYRSTCMGTYFAYSDDHGNTWQRTAVTLDPLVGTSGRFEEASLVQRADGSLLQVIRSWHGQSFVSESADRGSTWSPPRPSGVFSALAPSLVVRVPESTDLLMIWNPTWNPTASIAGFRSVLACAVSRDGGRTWGLPKALEADVTQWSEYPGVTFVGPHALVHYRVFNSDRKRCDLVQARVPLSWFYEGTFLAPPPHVPAKSAPATSQRSAPSPLRTYTFFIDAVKTEVDVAAIASAVRRVHDVTGFIELTPRSGFANITFDHSKVTHQEIAEAIAQGGRFPASLRFRLAAYRAHQPAIDGIFAKVATAAKVELTDPATGEFTVRLLPLQGAPQGFNLGDIGHLLVDAPPKGLGLTWEKVFAGSITDMLQVPQANRPTP